MANDWATRIPAAIAWARAELDGADSVSIQRQQIFVDTVVVTITAGEVELADRLWGFANDGPCPPWPDALIAFTTKIERLSHD